jgi:hypothetical protein
MAADEAAPHGRAILPVSRGWQCSHSLPEVNTWRPMSRRRMARAILSTATRTRTTATATVGGRSHTVFMRGRNSTRTGIARKYGARTNCPRRALSVCGERWLVACQGKSTPRSNPWHVHRIPYHPPCMYEQRADMQLHKHTENTTLRGGGRMLRWADTRAAACCLNATGERSLKGTSSATKPRTRPQGQGRHH